MDQERLVERDKLAEWRARWRDEGRRVIFTNGVFDLLHAGHVQYLSEARALGDLLIVGVNSDASVRRIKGPQRPLVPQQERAEVLLALRPVDYVTIFEETTAEESVRVLQPDVYVKGGDYTLAGENDPARPVKPLPEEGIVRAYGGSVRLIPFLPGHSTSALIEKILQVYR